MIYSITTQDKCVRSDVQKICSGLSDLYLRGHEKTASEIFRVLESKNLIKCDW